MSTATPLTVQKATSVCKKIGYADGVSAFENLLYIQATSSSAKIPTTFYGCLHCNQYHLTSASKEEARSHIEHLPLLIMAQRRDLYEYRMLQIAYAGNREELTALAKNSSITPAVQLLLCLNDDMEIRKLLAERTYVHLAAQRVLLNDVQEVQAALALNPMIYPSVRNQISPLIKPPRTIESPYLTSIQVFSYVMQHHRDEMASEDLFQTILFLTARGWVKKEQAIRVYETSILNELGLSASILSVYLAQIRQSGLWAIKFDEANNQRVDIFTPLFLDKIKK